MNQIAEPGLRWGAAQLPALERPSDTLNRAAAGLRAATLNKLLFAESEAAVVLGVSPEALKVWRREGRGPRWVRVSEKLVRYHLDDLREFAAGLQAPQAA